MFESSSPVREDDFDEPPVSEQARRRATSRLRKVMHGSDHQRRQHEAAARRFRIDDAGDDPRKWREPFGLVAARDDLAVAAPSPALALMIESVDPSTASNATLIEVAAAAERVLAWMNSQQLQVFAELAKRDLWSQPEPKSNRLSAEARRTKEELDRWRDARDEIAAALTISRQAAASRLDLAIALRERLPATLGALHRGDIDLTRARVLDDELANLSIAEARSVEAKLLPRLGVLTTSRLRREAAKQAMIIAPKTTNEQHEDAFKSRRVNFEPAPNGMSTVSATLSAETAAALRLALEAAAAAMRDDDPHDGRTMNQRRADALGELAWRSLDTERLGGFAEGTRLARQHGQRVRVNLTVPFSTLIGLDDYPGELEGYGPIPAAVARRIAQNHPDATWRRLITRPDDGSLGWLDPQRYRPPADLTEHIVLRDRTCRAPICNRSARYCDLDHTIPYLFSDRDGPDEPGQTVASNLGALCGTDHRGKHERGWRLTQPAPGHFRWTSPTGREYVLPPEAIGPILDPPDRVYDDFAARCETASPTQLVPSDAVPTHAPDPPTPRAQAAPADDPALDVPPF